MDILLIRESQTARGFFNRLRQRTTDAIADRINSYFNLTNPSTETYILPVVPQIKLKTDSPTGNYRGITEEYNLPAAPKLDKISWESFFPVYKNYSYTRTGSRENGFEYVDFFRERQFSQMPFRLVQYHVNLTRTAFVDTLIKVFTDDYYIVDTFEFHVDAAGDIIYSVSLSRFNQNLGFRLNHGNFAAQILQNLTVQGLLSAAGLV